MVPKGRTFPLQRVADLHGKKLGGQLGFTYPQLDGLGIELILEKDYATNLRKVAAGKLDGALIGSITGPFLARRLALLDHITFLPGAIGAVPLGAAFSKSALTADDLAAFDAAIKSLQASPTWHEILAANGTAELVQEWPVIPQW
jgi:polar amino acid transport system substrate-binding protein